jgi:hypothetical protein
VTASTDKAIQPESRQKISENRKAVRLAMGMG